MARPALFLDRDGTLNHMPKYPDAEFDSPRNPEDFILIDGVTEALKRLSPDLPIFVVTNQPGIAYGKIENEQVLAGIHNLMVEQMRQSGIYLVEVALCLHSDNKEKIVNSDYYHPNCGCRKPSPGMILDLAGRHDIDLENSWLVGDRAKDIEAGQAAGIKKLMLVTYELLPKETHPAATLVANLDQAIDIMLAE